MNTIKNDNITNAENYYKAQLEKDFDKVATFVHNDVHFIGPLAELHGKEAVVLAAKNFGAFLKNVEIRAKFSANNQVMMAYDMTAAEPIGKFRASVLMDFTDNLISRIELFYDAVPFVEKRDQIFEEGSK